MCVVADPCAGITCADGEECVNGTCVTTSANVVKSGSLTTDETWNSDNIYELANKVVVPDGITLTIEAGTIIKGREGNGSLATALIVARGGKIMAEGTSNAPIIFTSVLDNIEVGQKVGSNLTEFDREKWGGLIVLGRAPISAENGDTEAQIEGIPADDTFGRYGGDDAADNSGVLKYISIRHGGALIGDGNEINGLTLGGVGNGTVVENVEVVANLDDGIECFGGTVNITNAIVVWQGDDAIDLDQNYSGTINNFVIIQNSGANSDEALEIDGPENATYTEGLFTLTNGTIISDGQGSAADLKSKAQGSIGSCSFQGFNPDKMLKIRESFDTENSCSDKTDTYDYLVSGRFCVKNSEFVSSGATSADIAIVYTKSIDDDSGIDCSGNITQIQQDQADSIIESSGNTVVSSATQGATLSAFDNWSWAFITGVL
jgi:hypothetical protein